MVFDHEIHLLKRLFVNGCLRKAQSQKGKHKKDSKGPIPVRSNQYHSWNLGQGHNEPQLANNDLTAPDLEHQTTRNLANDQHLCFCFQHLLFECICA